MLVGVDEAGRGPLAGVVVACALYLPIKPPFVAKDSKQLSASVRQHYFSWIIDNAFYAVDLATAQEIDSKNILQATLLAFNRAIQKLINKQPRLAQARYIIDGTQFRTDLPIQYECMKKADQLVTQVSCASIVAKVTRDHLMSVADFLFPQWEFEIHKGYPTKRHRELIKKHSLSPLHRKTFAPCKKVCRGGPMCPPDSSLY